MKKSKKQKIRKENKKYTKKNLQEGGTMSLDNKKSLHQIVKEISSDIPDSRFFTYQFSLPISHGIESIFQIKYIFITNERDVKQKILVLETEDKQNKILLSFNENGDKKNSFILTDKGLALFKISISNDTIKMTSQSQKYKVNDLELKNFQACHSENFGLFTNSRIINFIITNNVLGDEINIKERIKLENSNKQHFFAKKNENKLENTADFNKKNDNKICKKYPKESVESANKSLKNIIHDLNESIFNYYPTYYTDSLPQLSLKNIIYPFNSEVLKFLDRMGKYNPSELSDLVNSGVGEIVHYNTIDMLIRQDTNNIAYTIDTDTFFKDEKKRGFIKTYSDPENFLKIMLNRCERQETCIYFNVTHSNFLANLVKYIFDNNTTNQNGGGFFKDVHIHNMDLVHLIVIKENIDDTNKCTIKDIRVHRLHDNFATLLEPRDEKYREKKYIHIFLMRHCFACHNFVGLLTKKNYLDSSLFSQCLPYHNIDALNDNAINFFQIFLAILHNYHNLSHKSYDIKQFFDLFLPNNLNKLNKFIEFGSSVSFRAIITSYIFQVKLYNSILNNPIASTLESPASPISTPGSPASHPSRSIRSSSPSLDLSSRSSSSSSSSSSRDSAEGKTKRRRRKIFKKKSYKKEKRTKQEKQKKQKKREKISIKKKITKRVPKIINKFKKTVRNIKKKMKKSIQK
jgi:hypothetical protein